ncbi:MAG: Asp-tRNA(Asn)/Glu-tRNA(Gln) amidotransferase subunit GatC [Candidatus Bathyarchaeia archaeon]
MENKKISKEELKHMASLAKLEISKDEEEIFLEHLSQILSYFKKIDEVNTEGVAPTYHVIEITNVFRKDEVNPSLPNESIKNAPQIKGRYIKAPKIA